MTFTAWISVLAVCVLGAMSPGPSLAMVLRHTLRGSRRHGVVTGLMHGLGVGLYALMVAAGLAVLFQRYPEISRIVAWAGALYLVWIAIKALRSRGEGALGESPATGGQSLATAARDGFMTAFLNPKVAVFFIALFSQFITPGEGWLSKAIMAATAWLVDSGWYVLVAIVLSHSRVLPWLRARSQWIDRITGVALILVAVRVVTL